MTVDPRLGPGDPVACLATVVRGADLSSDEAEALFTRIMEGDVPSTLIAALLAALRAKGEAEQEILGAARVMRARVTRVVCRRKPLIDTCGTGGDASGTFNVSTAAALVAAASGLAVAKHGNRAASSACGSVDVLEALGVVVDQEPDAVARSIDELGIGFLFAPRFHPAMRHAMQARREIGIRTVFNLLGPLTNPAGASRQLIGVPHPELVPKIARVLRDLGTEAAIVVHGSDGLDEISVCGPTHVAVVHGGAIEERIVQPEDLGSPVFRSDELRGGDPPVNARILRAVTEGRGTDAQRAVVAANAGAAIWIGGGADSLTGGVERAREVLDDGRAARLLDELVRLGRRTAGAIAAS